MTANSNLLRSIVTYSIILPLALWIGYELAQPLDRVSLVSFVVILGVISSPLLLKWHRPLLVLSWNLGAVVFFLPGRPDLWLVLAFVSLGIYIVQKTLVREFRFIHAPSLVAPLLFIVIVVFVTAKGTGGFGLQSLGSSTVGGRRYWDIFGAVAGFLAMLGLRIPPHKAMLYVGLFFLAAMATLIGNVVYNFVPQLYYILLLFPATQDFSVAATATVARFTGFALSFLAICWYLLARYGIVGMLGGRRTLRFALLLVALLISLGGGFRGNVVLICLTLTTLFFLERVWTTKYVGLFVIGATLVCALIVPFATKLPLPIQRSLSVLPIEVSPLARESAEGSSQWRIEMWQSVLPEIPKYFWFGRGLTLDAQEMDLEDALSRSGQATTGYASFVAVSDFHNGPLSLIIPFGIWGVIGWLWFIGASFRALWLNRKYGEAHLQTANNFIFALFLAKTVFFFFVFGNFYTDLATFCPLVGLSMSLNYGIRKPVVVKPVYRPIVLRRRRPHHMTLAPAAPRLGTAER
jgi:hypothetical protein